MKKILGFVYVACICLQSLAVNANDSTKINGNIVNLIGGYGYAAVNDIHQFFPDGTVTLNENHFTFGGNILYVKKNYIYGFTGYAIYGDTYVGDSNEITTQANYFTLDFGYLLTQKPSAKFKCYPLLSIGGGGTTIINRSTKDVTVADIQNNPFTETNLIQGNIVGDASLNLAYVLSKASDDEFSKGGFSIGMQLGYTYGLGIGEWKYTGAKVTDAKAYNLSMPYAKLTVGFHSF